MIDHCSCSAWKCGHRIGLFFVGLLILCFVWYGVHYAGRGLHLQIFQASFLWFKGMDAASIILATIQTYIYGYIVVGVWALAGCCNKNKKLSHSDSCCSGEKK